MKKFLLGIVMVVVVVAAFGTASSVFAQSSTPQGIGPGNGNGMMGGRGMRGGMMSSTYGTQTGLLHDEMITIYADKLGISVDDLNTRLAGGETMADIALSTELTLDEFRTLMADVRSQAIDQAVADGTLTQEQADWMNLRGTGMMAGGRGMRGSGQGLYANPDCPYYQTTP